ncbi:hypothetical protein P4V02_17320 [Bacillus subtilis]|nr:hypothetical protein [Bacillus subtilis]
MNKRAILLITIFLIIVAGSSFRYYKLNNHNDNYSPHITNLPKNRMIDTGAGITYHVLKPLKPIEFMDEDLNMKRLLYILPLDMTNTSKHEITLEQLSPDGMKYLFFGGFDHYYNLMAYNLDLPEKYQFNTSIPAGKTIRGYVGLKMTKGKDVNFNYKNFDPTTSKLFVYYSLINKSNKRITYKFPLN